MSWLVRVQAPHFCAGFVVTGRVVTEAAPILRRHSMGKLGLDVVLYFTRKGYDVTWSEF